MGSEKYIKYLLYVAVGVWAVTLLAFGQEIQLGLYKPIATATTLLGIFLMVFDLWLWKWKYIQDWLVKKPVIEGTWQGVLKSNWKPSDGSTLAPIEAYVVIRQTFSTLSIRLLTAESSSALVGSEIVCAPDGMHCASGVYRNEPRIEVRPRSPIHYGAIWLEIVTSPTKMLRGHYWTDRNTSGQIDLSRQQSEKFQDFNSAKAHFDKLAKVATVGKATRKSSMEPNCAFKPATADTTAASTTSAGFESFDQRPFSVVNTVIFWS
jgi:hypothetical protein